MSALQAVQIDGGKIVDWDSLHDEFASVLGFPKFYGRNGDAWIDCMSSLDTDFSSVRVAPGQMLLVEIGGADLLADRAPDILNFIYDASAFVNGRRIEVGQPPILLISRRVPN
ncbi:MAG: barstar family protein [Pseudomonadota bacterium]